MFNNVVVGVGEHDSWHDAIALATQLVSTDGRLTLANIYVFDTEPRLSAGNTSEDEAVERRRAAELLQRARAEAGRPAAARWRGAPSVGRGLHELAEQLEADVLVVGTSRQSVVGRLLRGDNARATLNGTPCAVAVAPSGYARRVCAIERVGVRYDGSARGARAYERPRRSAGGRLTPLRAAGTARAPEQIPQPGRASHSVHC